MIKKDLHDETFRKFLSVLVNLICENSFRRQKPLKTVSFDCASKDIVISDFLIEEMKKRINNFFNRRNKKTNNILDSLFK